MSDVLRVLSASTHASDEAAVEPTRRAQLLLRSEVHDCAGDAATALRYLEDYLRLARHSPADLRRHVELIHKVTSSSSSVPSRVAASLAAAAEEDAQALIATGNARHRLQLPMTFVSAIPSTPWYSTASEPQLATVAAVVVAAASDLRREFAVLDRQDGLLKPDSECIHLPQHGSWRAMSVNAPWNKDR